MAARPAGRMMAELHRRRVFRVIAAYLGAAFIILQVADLLAEPLRAPSWTMQGLIALLAVGLPIAALLGWRFQAKLVIERDEAEPVATVHPPTAARTAGRPSEVMRVAVLPFQLYQENDEIAFLGLALADAIAGSLTGIRTLQVRSPLRVREGQAPDDLDADAVLQGTILRAGQLLRIQVQLAGTADGAILWSESRQYAADDLIALQEQVAHQVVASLGVRLTPAEQSRLQLQQPANARAFELYLRANHASLEDRSWSTARDLYRESLALDPQYAPAWARLGRCYRVLAKYGGAEMDADENLSLARSALDEALRLDAQLPLAHKLYAQLEVELGHPVDGTARLLARIRLGTNDAELFAGLVHTCRYCGLLDESMVAHQRARDLDQYLPTSVAHTLFVAGRYSDALAALATTDTEYLQCLILAMLGRTDEALERARRFTEAESAIKRPFLASLVDLMEGRYAESAERLSSIGRLQHDAEALYYSARHYAFMGERERAIMLLRSAVDRGYYGIGLNQNDPWLKDIQDMAAFRQVSAEAERQRRMSADTLFAAGLREILGHASAGGGD